MTQEYEPRRAGRDRNRRQWDNRGGSGQRKSNEKRFEGRKRWDSKDDRKRWDGKDDRRRRDGRDDRKRWDDRDDRRRRDGRDDRKRWDDRDDRRRRDGRDDRKRWDDRDDRRRRDGGDDRKRRDGRDDRQSERRFPGQRSEEIHSKSGYSTPRRGEKPHSREYRSPDPNEPVLPAGVTADELAPGARGALRTLSGANQEIVARHLVMAGQLIDLDPAKAYEHAQAAVKRAGRVDVVREAAALTAYATGRYDEALREVRAVRRMRNDESLRAIEADCERGLGRPEKALEVIEQVDTSKLPLSEQAEVVLVAAGAHLDLEQTELGLVLVEDALAALPEDADTQVVARLMSMQADLLEELDRGDEAKEVLARIPEEDEPMEIMDIVEMLEEDVDHTNTPLRGTDKPLTEIYDGLVLDLDGVCFAGSEAIPHASAALNEAKDAGLKFSFATNNASRSAEEVAKKLEGFNIPAKPNEIMTSAMNLMYLLEEELDPGANVLVVGSEALRDQVVDTGFNAVDDAKGPVDAVVQGFSPDIDWAILSEAAYAINDGARYYATNTDSTLPLERGMALGNGALVAAVTRATGRRPEATGKPRPEIMERAAMFVGAQNPLGVGDRLETDTAAAVAAGMPTLHVLTGVSGANDVIQAKRGERPAYLGLDLRSLMDVQPQPKHHRDGTWTAGVSQPVKFARWGTPIISDIELRPEGDPVTINLDTYRALAAAGWEALDNEMRLRLPQFKVVANDDESGHVQKPNYEEPEAKDVQDVEVIVDAEEDDAQASVSGQEVAQVEKEKPGELVVVEEVVEEVAAKPNDEV